IFGRRYTILPITIIVMAVVSTVLCFEISRRTITGPLRFLPPLIWVFFGFRWFGADGSHRMLSPIFISLTILLLLVRSSRLYLVAAGVCLGFASFFTQQ